MGCPSAADLDALFDPGPPRDAARASALLAHVRECPRCHEALREDLSSRAAPPRVSKMPRPAIVLIMAIGIALIVFSRMAAPRRRHEGAAVGSASR